MQGLNCLLTPVPRGLIIICVQVICLCNEGRFLGPAPHIPSENLRGWGLRICHLLLKKLPDSLGTATKPAFGGTGKDIEMGWKETPLLSSLGVGVGWDREWSRAT